jgi:dephospho-CoA kinase
LGMWGGLEMKIVALVGLPGSGKTEAGKVFIERGFEYARFGQAVLDEVLKRGLEVNEKNERMVREQLRAEQGMDVMAKLLIPKFDRLIKEKDVIADGLYSWEEYKLLKERYGESLLVVALYANPQLRYERLASPERKYDPAKDKKAIYRSYTPEEAKSRDYAQIENLHQAGPIAMADITIINEGSVERLKQEIGFIIMRYCS